LEAESKKSELAKSAKEASQKEGMIDGNLEISAKTVEEATKKALTQLGVGLDEIEINVLSEGRGGILGIGAEDARIRVKLLRPERMKKPMSSK